MPPADPAPDPRAEWTFRQPGQHPALRWLIAKGETWLGREALLERYAAWRHSPAAQGPRRWAAFLAALEIPLEGAGPESMPREGPLIVVANHAHGLADGIALLALAEARNRPYRILLNRELARAPEIQPFALPVDLAETREAARSNLETRARALDLLAAGGTLALFPAGEVARTPWPFARAREHPWKNFVGRIAREAGAPVLPVRFEGQNGPLFQILASLCPPARVALLVRAFRRSLGKPLRVRAGAIVPPADLSALPGPAEATRLLFERVEALT